MSSRSSAGSATRRSCDCCRPSGASRARRRRRRSSAASPCRSRSSTRRRTPSSGPSAFAPGGAEYIKLYSEIVDPAPGRTRSRTSRARSRAYINGALLNGYADLKPGLNWVRSFGSRAQCGFLYENKWDQTLPDSPAGEEPKVAIVMGERAFDPDNKAYTLGVLRHELEHAVHNRMAANWLKRWRGDAKARAKPFQELARRSVAQPARPGARRGAPRGPQGRHRGARERRGVHGRVHRREGGPTLADAPAEEELRDVAGYWVGAPKAVRAEVVARLQAYGARLTGDLPARYLASLEKLRAENPAWADLFDPLIKAQKTRKRP